MKKFLLSLLTLVVATATAWADETTYTFTSKSWADATSSWTSGKAGNQFQDGRGVQVTSGASGANATTNSSFSDVSGIEVVYSTNASKGKGSIVVQVGTGSAKTFNVTPVGTTDTSASFSFSPTETGAVKLTVNCTENSIYIKSVTITTGGGSGPSTVDTPEISPASCNFSEDFEATITCTTDGATILYSLDGSEPSIVYNGPVSIDAGASVTLKAKATKADWNDSSVAEAVYTYVEPAPEGAKYQLVDISEISASDIVVIYDMNSERAMSNNNGTGAAPSAVAVGHNSDGSELVYTDVTDALKWNIVSTNDGYIIYPNGTDATWLYCTDTNNGVRVGTNANKYFTTASTDNRLYLKPTALVRYVGVYNNQDWRCYGSMGSNIANQNTKFYRYVVASNQVATPEISPNGGSDLTEAQTVTLSCETDGASIYYTLDGSTPTAESTLYSAPFQVSETTTVKAIGIKEGLTNSSVASATFSFRVAATSIADFYTKAEGGNTVYINFPMTVTAATAAEGKTFYVTDGTSYSAIYCSTANALSYGIGNVIPAGWNATLSVYHNLKEIVPSDVANMPTATSTVEVNYPVLRGTDIVAENQSTPGTLKNFELTEDMPNTATNINVTYDDASFVLRNSFLIDAVSAGTYDVAGVVTVYDNKVQFLPVDFVEVQPEPVPDVYILGTIKENGGEWSPSTGLKMTYDEVAEQYTASISVGAPSAYFSMSTALGEQWSDINGKGYRWGVPGGQDYTIGYNEYGTALSSSKTDNGAWNVPVGNYIVTWKFTGDNSATLTVEKAPSDVYILGNVNDLNWNPEVGIQMVRDEQTGIYSAEVYAEAGDMINFTHALGPWDVINNTNSCRFSVDQDENYTVTGIETDILLAYNPDPKSILFQNAGKYRVEVNIVSDRLMTASVYPLIMEGPEFSVTSKEFHEAFDLTITGPEGSTITYVLNDDIENPVTVNTNVAELTIPAEDTYVSAWYTVYGVDSEIVDEVYLYSEAVDVPAGQYWKVTASDQPLEAGKYLIVYEVPAASGSPLRDAASTSVLAFNGSLETLDATGNNVETPCNGDEIELDETADNYYFTITPTGDQEDTYTIQSASGLYIGNSSTSKNQIETSASPLVNTITIDEDGNAIITAEGGKVLRYNSTSGQDRFRYMNATSSNPVKLYYNGQTVTGVDKVAASDSEVVSTAYYNLQGVRLAAPAQGQIAIRVSTLANGQIRASKVVVR